MKVNQKGKGFDNYETPQWLFDELNERFNFQIDGACTYKNCKVKDNPYVGSRKYGYFFDNGVNGLEKDWAYKRVFLNCPFSQKIAWIRKAHKEVQENNCPLVVMILPTNSMDSKIWHEIIYPNYHYDIVDGRVNFIDPRDPLKTGANSGTTIVYFWKKTKGK